MTPRDETPPPFAEQVSILRTLAEDWATTMNDTLLERLRDQEEKVVAQYAELESELSGLRASLARAEAEVAVLWQSNTRLINLLEEEAYHRMSAEVRGQPLRMVLHDNNSGAASPDGERDG